MILSEAYTTTVNTSFLLGVQVIEPVGLSKNKPGIFIDVSYSTETPFVVTNYFIEYSKTGVSES